MIVRIEEMTPKGVIQGARHEVISPKPVSREFACEWQFNGLPTYTDVDLLPACRQLGPCNARRF